MGLDATVYCDCFEADRLREPSPYPALVYVVPNGNLDCRSEDVATLLEFDQWLLNRACQHKNGILLRHYIGNITLVTLLRNEFAREAERLPILLGKVLYSGSHTGDYLSVDEVRDLQRELSDLDTFTCSNEKNKRYVDQFRRQMQKLVDASMGIAKPISF
jgi:hypothetical protein